ncbi:hypothetical protein PCE1_004859 [Barthelona sp. PCE]
MTLSIDTFHSAVDNIFANPSTDFRAKFSLLLELCQPITEKFTLADLHSFGKFDTLIRKRLFFDLCISKQFFSSVIWLYHCNPEKWIKKRVMKTIKNNRAFFEWCINTRDQIDILFTELTDEKLRIRVLRELIRKGKSGRYEWVASYILREYETDPFVSANVIPITICCSPSEFNRKIIMSHLFLTVPNDDLFQVRFFDVLYPKYKEGIRFQHQSLEGRTTHGRHLRRFENWVIKEHYLDMFSLMCKTPFFGWSSSLGMEKFNRVLKMQYNFPRGKQYNNVISKFDVSMTIFLKVARNHPHRFFRTAFIGVFSVNKKAIQVGFGMELLPYLRAYLGESYQKEWIKHVAKNNYFSPFSHVNAHRFIEFDLSEDSFYVIFTKHQLQRMEQVYKSSYSLILPKTAMNTNDTPIVYMYDGSSCNESNDQSYPQLVKGVRDFKRKNLTRLWDMMVDEEDNGSFTENFGLAWGFGDVSDPFIYENRCKIMTKMFSYANDSYMFERTPFIWHGREYTSSFVFSILFCNNKKHGLMHVAETPWFSITAYLYFCIFHNHWVDMPLFRIIIEELVFDLQPIPTKAEFVEWHYHVECFTEENINSIFDCAEWMLALDNEYVKHLWMKILKPLQLIYVTEIAKSSPVQLYDEKVIYLYIDRYIDLSIKFSRMKKHVEGRISHFIPHGDDLNAINCVNRGVFVFNKQYFARGVVVQYEDMWRVDDMPKKQCVVSIPTYIYFMNALHKKRLSETTDITVLSRIATKLLESIQSSNLMKKVDNKTLKYYISNKVAVDAVPFNVYADLFVDRAPLQFFYSNASVKPLILHRYKPHAYICNVQAKRQSHPSVPPFLNTALFKTPEDLMMRIRDYHSMYNIANLSNFVEMVAGLKQLLLENIKPLCDAFVMYSSALDLSYAIREEDNMDRDAMLALNDERRDLLSKAGELVDACNQQHILMLINSFIHCATIYPSCITYDVMEALEVLLYLTPSSIAVDFNVVVANRVMHMFSYIISNVFNDLGSAAVKMLLRALQLPKSAPYIYTRLCSVVESSAKKLLTALYDSIIAVIQGEWRFAITPLKLMVRLTMSIAERLNCSAVGVIESMWRKKHMAVDVRVVLLTICFESAFKSFNYYCSKRELSEFIETSPFLRIWEHGAAFYNVIPIMNVMDSLFLDQYKKLNCEVSEVFFGFFAAKVLCPVLLQQLEDETAHALATDTMHRLLRARSIDTLKSTPLIMILNDNFMLIFKSFPEFFSRFLFIFYVLSDRSSRDELLESVFCRLHEFFSKTQEEYMQQFFSPSEDKCLAVSDYVCHITKLGQFLHIDGRRNTDLSLQIFNRVSKFLIACYKEYSSFIFDTSCWQLFFSQFVSFNDLAHGVVELASKLGSDFPYLNCCDTVFAYYSALLNNHNKSLSRAAIISGMNIVRSAPDFPHNDNVLMAMASLIFRFRRCGYKGHNMFCYHRRIVQMGFEDLVSQCGDEKYEEMKQMLWKYVRRENFYNNGMKYFNPLLG